MSEKRGCMKTGLFGCLAVLVILIVFVGGTALVAWNHSSKVDIQDQVLTPQAAGPPNHVKSAKSTDVPAGTGRVVLDLSQGEFYIHAEHPGQGVRVEATYDTEVYLVEDYFESFPDSSWVYGVRSKKTISGLHSSFPPDHGRREKSEDPCLSARRHPTGTPDQGPGRRLRGRTGRAVDHQR